MAKKKAVKKKTTSAAAKRKPRASKPSNAQSIKPPNPVASSADAYERHKERARERQAKLSRSGRDIGAMPPPKNPECRERCRHNLGLFYKSYFPDVFVHPWSRVHLLLIRLISMVILSGALLAVGIPRGFGKTSMCVRAVIWAIAYRHHSLVMLVAATDEAAEAMIADIQSELTENTRLLEDFPELCMPLRELDGTNQKGRTQLCCGERTNVKARAKELWTGDINGQHGACLWAHGILAGGIRGKRRTVGGKVLRPTLGLGDDCQTRASAASARSVQRRRNILQADLPGLPGQSESWSFLSTWTVIEPDDAADWVLDRQQAPDYHGIREKFLDSLPNEDAMELWKQWNDIRTDCQQRCGVDIDSADWETDGEFTQDMPDPLEPAHVFYDEHQDAMHAGASVVWDHAYDQTKYRSALEKAMHWYFRDRLAFYSELQNDPSAMMASDRPQLVRTDVRERFAVTDRQKLPRNTRWLTAGIDVQGKVLYYSVRAWSEDSTSTVIEYGTWPGQSRQYYTLNDIKLTLDAVYADLPTWEVRLGKAIKDLLTKLFDTQWHRDDGLSFTITAAGIDANYEATKVKQALAASGFYGRVLPTHGRGFRPPLQALNDLPLRDRDIAGDGWRVRAPREGDIQYVTFDADSFKSTLRDRLAMDIDHPGALTLFNGPGHDMWADHVLSERPHEITDNKTQRTVEVWELPPNRPDNHLLDCEVINQVVGSMLGIKLPTAFASEDKQPARAMAAMPATVSPTVPAHAGQRSNLPFGK